MKLERLRNVFVAVLMVSSTVAFAADVEEGKRLIGEKKYAQAEQLLREVVTEEPDNTAARVALGNALMMQDKLDPAMELLDQAAKDDPENTEIYQYRGMILLKQEKFTGASEQLNKSVELDPKNAYAHYYLAMASSRLKRTDLMVKHFQLFLQLAPNAPEAPKVKSLLRSL